MKRLIVVALLACGSRAPSGPAIAVSSLATSSVERQIGPHDIHGVLTTAKAVSQKPAQK